MEKESVNIKSTISENEKILIHYYLFNLQKGIDSLKFEKILLIKNSIFNGVKIKLPYKNNNGNNLIVYARPIYKKAWRTENPDDYPLLLTDKGITVNNFKKQNKHFSIPILEAWQLTASNYFNNLIDLQSSQETKEKFGKNQSSINWNLICITSHNNLPKQLCIFTTFLITVKDLYNYYYSGDNNYVEKK